MKATSQLAEKNASKIAAALVLVIAAIFAFKWAQGDRTDLSYLLAAGGFILCSPCAYFSPGWGRPSAGSRPKVPVLAVVALAAGLIIIVAAFIAAPV